MLQDGERRELTRSRERMYKDRFAKWGFRKYLNPETVLDIARGQASREPGDPKAREYARPDGRGRVRSATVRRYLVRNRHLQSEWQAVVAGHRSRMSSPAPPRVLSPPDTLRLAEDAIMATRDLLESIPFQLGAPDDQDWLESQEKALCFSNILFSATRGKHGELVKRLRQASGVLEPIMADPYSNFPLHFLLRIRAVDIGDPLKIMLDHAVELSNTIYGTRHPNFRLWKSLLASLHKSDLEQLTRRLQGVCFGYWKSRVFAGAKALDDRVHPPPHISEAKEQIGFLAVLRRLSAHAGASQPRLFFAVAWAFAYLGLFDEAVATMRDIESSLLAMGPPLAVQHFKACVEAERGDYVGAAQRLQAALDGSSLALSTVDGGLPDMYGMEVENFLTMAAQYQVPDRGLAYVGPKLIELPYENEAEEVHLPRSG
jgi:hypothetical protein